MDEYELKLLDLSENNSSTPKNKNPDQSIIFMNQILENLTSLRSRLEQMLNKQREKGLKSKNGFQLKNKEISQKKSLKNMVFLQNNKSWILMITIMKGIEKSMDKVSKRMFPISPQDFKEKEVYHMGIK